MINLMMAEDNADIRRLLSTYLGRKPEIRVVGTAESGDAAERMLADCVPDVLLLDLVMPGMDGLELMLRMRARKEQERTKIIVLSGLMRDDIVRRAMELGATYYMAKPVDPELLYRRIVYFGKERPGVLTPTYEEPQPERERASAFLQRAGISPSSKGYAYLREAICAPRQKDDASLQVTKTIYPALAKQFAVSRESVERAIRASIESAWNKGSLQRSGFFGETKRPGNGEFILRGIEETARRLA